MSTVASRRILLVHGHPDPAPGHLCRALGEAYAEAARAAGHAVTEIDLASVDVPILRSDAEFRTRPVPQDLAVAADALVTADHVVLVFPLWLGTMPALVKAFLEQLFRPGVAFRYEADGSTTMLMKGKSARVVVTMGMPALAYRWWFGAHGVRGLERNVLAFSGMRPVRRTLFGMIETVSPDKRAGWLQTMRDLGRSGI